MSRVTRAFRFARVGLPVLFVAGACCALPAANEKGAEKPAPADRRQEAASGAEGASELSPLLRAARDNRQLAEAPARVYTNEDLERVPAPASRDEKQAEGAAAKPAPGDRPGKPQDVDPLEWMAAREAQAADRAQRIAAAEKRLTEARERVAMLQKRELAVRNPLLPRPKLSDEEAEEWSGLNGEQRLERTETQLAEARAEVQAAQRELEQARAGAGGS